MKHPEPNDLLRIMEKISGLQLHWYQRYWIGTTKRIDYAIDSVQDNDNKTQITLHRIGEFPMPMDVMITYKDGSQELYYASVNELMGNKPAEDRMARTVLPTWNWVNPFYSFVISRKVSDIRKIEIDPSLRMADIDRKNNVWNAN